MNHVELAGMIYSKWDRRTAKALDISNVRIECDDGAGHKNKVDCDFWGPLSVAIHPLSKGAAIRIRGTLRNKNWVDRKGKETWKLVVNVTEILEPKSVAIAAAAGATTLLPQESFDDL